MADEISEETRLRIAALVHEQIGELLERIIKEQTDRSLTVSIVNGVVAAVAEALWNHRKDGATLEEAIQTWTTMGTTYMKQFAERDGEHADH